ncbi:alpha-L-fucosidase [Streptomyces sp. M10(2022)]
MTRTHSGPARRTGVAAVTLAAFAGLLGAAPSTGPDPATKDYEPTVESLNSHPTPQWFNDDKFGIFIHWGAYSVPAWGPAAATPSGTGRT